eukprot:scaffold1908_cov104-Isochrysis_galbana.AAC.4
MSVVLASTRTPSVSKWLGSRTPTSHAILPSATSASSATARLMPRHEPGRPLFTRGDLRHHSTAGPSTNK